MQNLLIVKLSSLGDVVHTLPAAQALRQAFPRAHLAWAVDRTHASVLQGQPWLDELIVHERRNLRTFADFVRRLRQRRWDAALDFQGLFRSAVVTWLSGARRRIGFAAGRELSPWFYNERVRLESLECHAVDRYYQLAEHAGGSLPGMPLKRPYLEGKPPIASGDTGRLFPLHPSQEDRRAIDEWLLKHRYDPSSQRLVVMLPHARREANLWPVESFAALAQRLSADKSLRIVLTGSKESRPLGDRISELAATPLWRADGEMSLLGTVELLSRSAVMVTGDTGPMHLAAAVGTPLVVLCGATNPLKTGPYCTNAVVIDKRLPCGHCKGVTCARGLQVPECMTAITVDEVYAAVCSQLSKAECRYQRSA